MSYHFAASLLILSLAISAAHAAGAGDNMLTQSERESGFELLFDGETLDGWSPAGGWAVEDGMIVGRTDGNFTANTYLFTDASYGDFILRASCKLEGGNSGIQYRSQMRDDGEAEGYQADMSDARDPAAPSYWGCLYEASTGRAIMVDGWAGLAETVLNRGGWNEYEIICQGDTLIHRINGLTCVEIEDDRAAEGRIGMQLHVGPAMTVRYKNVRLQKLEANELTPAPEPGVPASWTPLREPDDFEASGAVSIADTEVEGAIRLDGTDEPGWLRSKEQYTDFVLHVEWRVPMGGASGVVFRSAAEGRPWAEGHACFFGLAGGGPGIHSSVAEVSEGEWHSFEIHCVGTRVSVFEDDVLALDVDTADQPELADKASAGHVGLLSAGPGAWVEYRNVRLKELQRPQGW